MTEIREQGNERTRERGNTQLGSGSGIEDHPPHPADEAAAIDADAPARMPPWRGNDGAASGGYFTVSTKEVEFVIAVTPLLDCAVTAML